MSDRTALFQDILKGLANSSSLSGKSVLLTDSNGNLGKSNKKIMTVTTGVTDLDSITRAGFYQPVSNAAGGPPDTTVNSSDQIMYLGTTYGVMIYFSLNEAAIYKRANLNGHWTSWYNVTLTKIE